MAVETKAPQAQKPGDPLLDYSLPPCQLLALGGHLPIPAQEGPPAALLPPLSYSPSADHQNSQHPHVGLLSFPQNSTFPSQRHRRGLRHNSRTRGREGRLDLPCWAREQAVHPASCALAPANISLQHHRGSAPEQKREAAGALQGLDKSSGVPGSNPDSAVKLSG